MRKWLELGTDEKEKATQLRLHVLAEHADWPQTLTDAIAEYVAGAIGVAHADVVAHVQQMLFDHFSVQASQDVAAALYPSAGELVIVLQDDTQIICEGASLIAHKSDGILNRRLRGVTRQARGGK